MCQLPGEKLQTAFRGRRGPSTERHGNGWLLLSHQSVLRTVLTSPRVYSGTGIGAEESDSNDYWARVSLGEEAAAFGAPQKVTEGGT